MNANPRDRLYLDVHVLQTVPPSNLNRDDAGTPKQAVYGGVRRARVSSQAWKRATRVDFESSIPRERLATRTKKISRLLSERVAERCGLDDEAATRLATSLLAPLEIKQGKKAAETAYLLFFGRAQLDSLVDLVKDDAQDLAAMDDKALKVAVVDRPVRDCLSAGHPIDVALFGRMVANVADLNVDAATQVAHAISTHPVDVEFDYYTAVDDENPREDTGAGMIGTIEFNSATLYRYATVGVHQLLENLGGDTEAGLEALGTFVTSFVRSMPAGYQNSFGHRTVPNVVVLTLREDQPVNLVSAFEAPVRGSDGVTSESAGRLADEFVRVRDMWGLAPSFVAATYTGTNGAQLESAFGETRPFSQSVEDALAAVRSRVTDAEE